MNFFRGKEPYVKEWEQACQKRTNVQLNPSKREVAVLDAIVHFLNHYSSIFKQSYELFPDADTVQEISALKQIYKEADKFKKHLSKVVRTIESWEEERWKGIAPTILKLKLGKEIKQIWSISRELKKKGRLTSRDNVKLFNLLNYCESLSFELNRLKSTFESLKSSWVEELK